MNFSRVIVDVVHDWECRSTKLGKRNGPCNCPALAVEKELVKQCRAKLDDGAPMGELLEKALEDFAKRHA